MSQTRNAPGFQCFWDDSPCEPSSIMSSTGSVSVIWKNKHPIYIYISCSSNTKTSRRRETVRGVQWILNRDSFVPVQANERAFRRSSSAAVLRLDFAFDSAGAKISGLGNAFGVAWDNDSCLPALPTKGTPPVFHIWKSWFCSHLSMVLNAQHTCEFHCVLGKWWIFHHFKAMLHVFLLSGMSLKTDKYKITVLGHWNGHGPL